MSETEILRSKALSVLHASAVPQSAASWLADIVVDAVVAELIEREIAAMRAVAAMAPAGKDQPA